MIDIHSHILPGIDDGAQTLEDSLDIAMQAVKQGISTIVATPHHNRYYKNDKESILRKVTDLNEFLKKKGIPLNIVSGQECRLYGELIDDLRKGEILSINDGGKYILIEFPSSTVPMYSEQLFYNLMFDGITPIIVHPERNNRLLEEPDLLYEFVEKGVLTQVTASSVVGVFGQKMQKFSMRMLEANLVHFIASDAHNTNTRDSRIKEAYELIGKKFDGEYVAYLTENTQAVIEGKYIQTRTPQRIKKKCIFGIF
jgi:protein-tyrosine phosphatase